MSPPDDVTHARTHTAVPLLSENSQRDFGTVGESVYLSKVNIAQEILA